MSCGSPYCLGTTGTGCIPALTPPYTRSCPCKCCPPRCFDEATLLIQCGTPVGQWSPGLPPEGYSCCATGYFGCDDPRFGYFVGTCEQGYDPCYENCFGAIPFVAENYNNDCESMIRMRNRYGFIDSKSKLPVKFEKERKARQSTAKNYHDFFGFTEDDYNYEFLINDSINALNLGDGNCQIECQRNLEVKITFSGCCFSCTPSGKADCRPMSDDMCAFGGSGTRSLEVRQCYAAIGDGTVNVSLPSIPCGQLYCYVNGIEGTSAAVKDCKNFCVEIIGIFSRYDCCTCCERGNSLTVHNWGSTGFREYKKSIMQKNLAEKMKKIKF